MYAARKASAAAERLLSRVEWDVARKLDGVLQGDYPSLFIGQGLDFAEVREYQPGDDARYMDWNVTARLDAPHVRQYHEDREITAWLVLDTSASLDFGTARARKSELLLEVAGSLATLLTRHGNRVGAMCFANTVQAPIPARTGRRQALAVVDQVLKAGPAPAGGTTDLAGALQTAAHSIRRRSLIVVVSDFIAAPGWEAHLGRLAQRHDVIAVWLGDRREEELPDIGMVVLEDAESGEQVRVQTGDARFQQRFTALVEARRTRLERAFAASGARVLQLDTEDDVLTNLVAFGTRKRASRLARAHEARRGLALAAGGMR